MVKTGIKCRENLVRNIFISSLTPINNEQANAQVKEINTILKSYCKHYNLGFICNNFLTINDLRDTVHFTTEGQRKLVDNYIDILNNC